MFGNSHIARAPVQGLGFWVWDLVRASGFSTLYVSVRLQSLLPAQP